MAVDLESDTGTESRSDGAAYLERLVGGPGVSLLAMALVSLAMWTGAQAGNITPFVLTPPFDEAWWQLPLSVFAHSGMAHLTSNATIIVVAGGLVAITAGIVRYHLFFVTTGIAAGVAQVAATDALGEAGGVLGASGAALALVAYVLMSNDISSWVLRHVPRWVVGVAIVGVAVALTLRSAGTQIANVAHLIGALLGAVAGHVNLLRAE